MEHLGVVDFKNSLKRVRGFQIELEFESVWWAPGRGKNWGTRRKNLSEQGREPTTNSTHIWRQKSTWK